METNKKQLILFVNQHKFFSLFSDTYSMKDNQIAFVKNESLIIKTNTEINNDELASSHIIIKPDASSKKFTPTCPFKILYHGETKDEKNDLDDLKKDKNCEGWKEQSEEINTLYEEIVKLINTNYCQKSFDHIYLGIPKKNAKLKIALNFLHNCLGDHTTIPPLPVEFQNCEKQYNILKKEKNNNNLRILRDAMLREAGIVC